MKLEKDHSDYKEFFKAMIKKHADTFLIVYKDHTGDCTLFWRSNESGYTVDINKAGRYTEEEAKRLCGRRPGKDHYVSQAIAMSKAIMVVPKGELNEYDR